MVQIICSRNEGMVMAPAATPAKASGKRPERAADGDRRPVAHPLSGANLGTLLSAAGGSGPLPARAWGTMAGAIGSALGRAPFSLAERAYAAALRRGRPLPEAPVFLLGHWRSGTTHLYNVLAKGPFGYVDPIAAGLPWDCLLLARWLRPFLLRMLPEGRFIDQVTVGPDSPQEDETAIANMTRLSYFHAIYFPREFHRLFRRGLFLEDARPDLVRQWERRFDHYLWKLQRLQPGRPLLIKNPVYTGRVAQLLRLYPEARFIHIVRNPHEVFASTRGFLAKMFEALALQPWAHVDIEATVIATYRDMMTAYLADTADLPRDRLVEIAFEDLEAQPLAEIERIHTTLALRGFEQAQPAYERYLGEVQRYRRAARRFPERDIALVEREWRPFLDRWGYGRPEAA